MKALTAATDRAKDIEALRARGYKLATFKTAPVVVLWNRTKSGGYTAMAWARNAYKPAWHYSFSSFARLCRWVEQYISKVIDSEAFRSDRKTQREQRRKVLRAADHFAVGDVIYNSWGYEQTNVDFYEVVEVLAKSVRIRAIAQNYADRSFMSGPCQPRRGHYTGEASLKQLSEYGNISFKHGGASKWDGRAVWSSHYA